MKELIRLLMPYLSSPTLAKLAIHNELELLRKENSSLDAKILEHEIAIGAGAFNPAVSRVLEIKDSPAARHQAIRQQMLDALKEENAALLQSLTELQQQQQPAGNLLGLQQDAFGDQEVALQDKNVVPVASYNRLLGDFKRLQEEFADNDKRSKRLKQVCVDYLSYAFLVHVLIRTVQTINTRLLYFPVNSHGRSRQTNSWMRFGPFWATRSTFWTTDG